MLIWRNDAQQKEEAKRPQGRGKTSKDNKKVSESAEKIGGIWDMLQVFVKGLYKQRFLLSAPISVTATGSQSAVTAE